MSATGADPQSESERLRQESRTWGLIRRALPLGRSIGSLFYLISVGLIASWIVAVFFGVGLFFLMPRSGKLASGLSPGGTSFDPSSAETPWLLQSTSRLNRLSSVQHPEPPQPMGDAAADKGRPVVASGSPMTPDVNPRPMPAEAPTAHTIDEPPGQALTVELGTISAAADEAAPVPAHQDQFSTALEPRGASRSSHTPSSRKPLARRPSKTRTAPPHAPVNAIEDVLQKHSHLLK
jgi:hypothetical protein